MLYYCSKENIEDMHSVLQIYIESGMPALLALSNGTDGHAVLAIGHKEIISADVTRFLLKSAKDVWKDISFYKKQLVVIDDNKTPFDIVSVDCPAEHYKGKLKEMKIMAFLVPFHKHMFMDAHVARELTKVALDDTDYGLHKFGKKWITRLLLTSSSSFKEFTARNEHINPKIKELFLHTSFPKFIWICELYRQEKYGDEISSGILIIDSTGGASLNAIIYYIIDESRIVQKDSLTWESKHKMVRYESLPYRNNLKGNWNSWKV